MFTASLVLFQLALLAQDVKGDVILSVRDSSTCPCIDDTLVLNCTHPYPQKDDRFILLWERNRERIVLAGVHSILDVELSYTAITVKLIKDECDDLSWAYRCYLLHIDTFIRNYSNEVLVKATAVSPPRLLRDVVRAGRIELTLSHDPDPDCYGNLTFIFHVAIYQSNILNSIPVDSFNATSSIIVMDRLVENTMYGISIIAQDARNIDHIYSDPLLLNITTTTRSVIQISEGLVCFNRKVQLTCHHHDISVTTSSGPIFNQTSPVVWMKDGERIDLPDTYHMVVSQNNTETLMNVTTRKSVFLNGEANYSCAVVYADGSMEESEPVTVRIINSSLCHEFEHEKDAKNGPWEFAFGTVMLLLMLSWIIFVATCIAVKCCYNKRIHRHHFRNNQQLSVYGSAPNLSNCEDGQGKLEQNPAYECAF